MDDRSRRPRNVSSHTLTGPVSTPASPTVEGMPAPMRRLSFGLGFLSSITSLMRHGADDGQPSPPRIELPSFMSNSPTIANLSSYAGPERAERAERAGERAERAERAGRPFGVEPPQPGPGEGSASAGASARGTHTGAATADAIAAADSADATAATAADAAVAVAAEAADAADATATAARAVSADAEAAAADKDGFFSIRLTPVIDHSSSTSGLYFAPIIRKIKADSQISIGRYTEKNKLAAHAPQGSSAPVVFKLKVVLRTHALFSCNEDGQWFLRDCKLSLGTFLNHIRLAPALQELSLMPIIDGDIIQLGMDYRGGTEEVYRCVKMRCEFNKSWQRKVNQFNLEIHKKFRELAVGDRVNPIAAVADDRLECAICLLQLEPCQALFISPCLHSWHYKCIRPIIIKSYPQFYCPNCRLMCDLETDIEDE
jgi:pSer/pThr/pTyr-binding forkhead associated (FHA) protein